jgi:hypothetical protein
MSSPFETGFLEKCASLGITRDDAHALLIKNAFDWQGNWNNLTGAFKGSNIDWSALGKNPYVHSALGAGAGAIGGGLLGGRKGALAGGLAGGSLGLLPHMLTQQPGAVKAVTPPAAPPVPPVKVPPKPVVNSIIESSPGYTQGATPLFEDTPQALRESGLMGLDAVNNVGRPVANAVPLARAALAVGKGGADTLAAARAGLNAGRAGFLGMPTASAAAAPSSFAKYVPSFAKDLGSNIAGKLAPVTSKLAPLAPAAAVAGKGLGVLARVATPLMFAGGTVSGVLDPEDAVAQSGIGSALYGGIDPIHGGRNFGAVARLNPLWNSEVRQGLLSHPLDSLFGLPRNATYPGLNTEALKAYLARTGRLPAGG